LFCFGNNQSGQLGTGDNISINVPIELKFFKNEILKEIICRNHFSFALCGISHFIYLQVNKVFSWGINEFGQLGHGDTKERNIPTKVDFFDGKEIIQIACGYNHCLALEGNFNSIEFKRMEIFIFGERMNKDNLETTLKLMNQNQF
jgi:alpha-tubulin suppressor-like RCC1 family protein